MASQPPALPEPFNRQSSIVNRQSVNRHGLSRRQALAQARAVHAGVPVTQGQDLPKTEDPVLHPINIFDFEKLAQAKMDKVAWDYLSEGAEDEVSLRDNREALIE